MAAKKNLWSSVIFRGVFEKKPREYQRVQGSAWSHQMEGSACDYNVWRRCRESAWFFIEDMNYKDIKAESKQV